MINTYKTRLSKKTALTEHVYLLTFQLLEPPTLEFKAGQYLILLCPHEGGTPVRRLYSIASSTSQKNSFDLLVEIVPQGVASTYFLAMKEQDEVQFQGPAGMFTLRELQPGRERVQLATGTGLAPMLSMIEEISATSPTAVTHLFWGLPYFRDIYYFDVLKAQMQKYPNLRLSICLSRETTLDMIPEVDRHHFLLGRVTHGLETSYPTLPSEFDYYICGGRTVVESLRQYLAEKGVAPQHIIFEKF